MITMARVLEVLAHGRKRACLSSERSRRKEMAGQLPLFWSMCVEDAQQVFSSPSEGQKLSSLLSDILYSL